MKTLLVKTEKKKQVVDITQKVNQLVGRNGWSEGILHLFITHTTAALTTADLDPGTDLDMLDAFNEMIPKLRFRHPHDPSHVGDHIVSSLIGPSETVHVQDGKAILGTWQRVVLIEFNGPRERTLLVTFTSQGKK